MGVGERIALGLRPMQLALPARPAVQMRLIKWGGTAFGVTGALLLATNLPQSGWAFPIMLVQSVCWTVAGLRMGEPSIWTLNLVYTLVNLVGIARWLVPS